MPYTQDQLDELDEVIASGAKETRFQDRALVNRDLDELLRIKSIIDNEVNQSQSNRRKVILLTGRSGL